MFEYLIFLFQSYFGLLYRATIPMLYVMHNKNDCFSLCQSIRCIASHTIPIFLPLVYSVRTQQSPIHIKATNNGYMPVFPHTNTCAYVHISTLQLCWVTVTVAVLCYGCASRPCCDLHTFIDGVINVSLGKHYLPINYHFSRVRRSFTIQLKK